MMDDLLASSGQPPTPNEFNCGNQYFDIFFFHWDMVLCHNKAEIATNFFLPGGHM